MGNRILKESICTSEKLAKLTDFEYRLWVGLLTQVDDYGCGDARFPIVRNFVFPLREDVTTREVERAMKRLEKVGCIRFYEVDGASYFWFPNWLEHQRLRNHKPKFPQPPELAAVIAARREEEALRKEKRRVSGKEKPYDYEPVYESFEGEEPAAEAAVEAASPEEPASGEESPLSGFTDQECLDLVRELRRRGRPLTDSLEEWVRAHPWLVAEMERRYALG